jgi:hypothetical protein
LSPTTTTQPAQRESRSIVKNPWLWVGIGVVVAGAAAGTAVALTREDGTASASGGSSGAVLKGP